MIFSSVCALEFSVNKRIGHSYGELAGISASALTGAFYLTAADHLLFRRQKGEEATDAIRQLFKVRKTAIWTGFSPMIGREAIFISSVMHLGPALGSKLNNGSEKDSLLWSSLGRFITGVSTTLVSQPFDVLARDMQVQLYNDSSKKPSLLHSFKRIQNEFHANVDKEFITKHPLFRGAIPRMGLATVGGVLAGGFFDGFRKAIDNMDEIKIIENVTPLQSRYILEKDRKPKLKN